jgi:putative endonuclease
LNKTELGRFGENLAHDFLVQKGFILLEQNWRYKRLEVDLIALHRNFFVVIEVKTRKNEDFGSPDESVGHKKIDFLAEAAAAYQEENGLDLETRFDIISIIMQGKIPKIVHIEEAFHP